MLREHQRTQNKLKTDLGDTLLTALNDEEVYEIMLNPDGILWVDGFRGKRPCGRMTAAAAKNLINTIASISDGMVTEKHPTFAGELWLEFDGEFKLFRFQGFIPPVVAFPAFAIRKHAGRVIALDEYVQQEIITLQQEALIRQCVANRMSIMVVGGTQSGKTTFCNAILDCVARTHPDDRVIILEDVGELRCPVQDCVTMRSSQVKTLNDLLRDALRMRPDRIIVGEVRGAEAHSMIKAYNTGHPGGLTTLHSNSAESGILRLEQLILEAGVVPVPESIVEAINVVVFIQKGQKCKNGRQVTSILRLTGHDKDHGYITARCD